MKTTKEIREEFLKKWSESVTWVGGPFGSLGEFDEDSAGFVPDTDGIADYLISLIESERAGLREAVGGLKEYRHLDIPDALVRKLDVLALLDGINS